MTFVVRVMKRLLLSCPIVSFTRVALFSLPASCSLSKDSALVHKDIHRTGLWFSASGLRTGQLDDVRCDFELVLFGRSLPALVRHGPNRAAFCPIWNPTYGTVAWREVPMRRRRVGLVEPVERHAMT